VTVLLIFSQLSDKIRSFWGTRRRQLRMHIAALFVSGEF
jgi:hypothetical protein